MKSRSVSQIVKEISSLRIQGAQNIAKASLEAINFVVHSSHASSVVQFRKEISKASDSLIKARATEPLLRNYMKAVKASSQTSSLRESKEKVLATLADLTKYHGQAKVEITDIAQQKILKGSLIFTHCHSSTVTSAIIAAHKNKKRVTVANAEARPKYQGRITARELSDEGIMVHHMVDSAAGKAIKKADIMFIGADAITSYAVINKIGSSLFAQIAHQYDVPVYICAHALKFDPDTLFGKSEPIEERDAKEVWDKPPKNVHIHNPAFDEVEQEHITGIISELGVFPLPAFIEEVRRQYPWIFEK